jgi:hypothetical protein
VIIPQVMVRVFRIGANAEFAHGVWILVKARPIKGVIGSRRAESPRAHPCASLEAQDPPW